MPSRRGVRDTYERIAAHFSQTREYPWPEVESFLADRSGALGLDVGCGNGRHAELLTDHAERVVGVDVSRGLLAEARARAPTVSLLQGDASRLPVADDCAALAVFVATLHHLPTAEARRASLDELARVLAPGGRALVSTWATAHDRFDRTESFDTTLDWTLPGGETVERFYHISTPADFRALLADSALAVERTTVSSGNCYAVVGPGVSPG
ncbi:MAG: class I SAM-dependent methyltransferase [Halobacteriaceae archaeon]